MNPCKLPAGLLSFPGTRGRVQQLFREVIQIAHTTVADPVAFGSQLFTHAQPHPLVDRHIALRVQRPDAQEHPQRKRPAFAQTRL